MEWWHWVLIGIGVVLIGWIKISVFRMMKQNKTQKKRFEDEY
ncbi:MAG: hypothetical protein ACOX25_03960 [Caldicoprobacterales bacterium]|jgi:hypothetical protein